MRNRVTFGLFFVLGACTSSTGDFQTVQSPHSELHIGEYLQVISPEQVATFIRDPLSDQKGLVTLHLDSHEIRVIDGQASEGRDLIFRNEQFFYRLQNSIWRVREGEQAQKIWDAEHLERLQDLQIHNDQPYYLLTENKQQSRLVCGEQQRSLPGYALKLFFHEEKLYLILSEQERLLLLSTEDCGATFLSRHLIRDDVEVRYLTLLSEAPLLHLAYLNEKTGQFFYSRFNFQTEETLFEIVDGKEGENYLGMDAQFFRGPRGLGLIYLDGWELKLKMAQRLEDSWDAQTLDFKGALGFYTQILRQNEAELDIVFHAYRQALPNKKSSFEDLLRAQIQLTQP